MFGNGKNINTSLLKKSLNEIFVVETKAQYARESRVYNNNKHSDIIAKINDAYNTYSVNWKK
jgi:hypothetical protein